MSSRTSEPLSSGQKIRDPQAGSEGVIVEFACQYAHPKAAPVYSYLVRWSDGRTQAYTEAAFSGSDGFELLD